MSKRRVFLIVQAVLCILTTVLPAAFAVLIYIEGSAWQAAGHPSDWIYTREKAGQAFLMVLPFFCISAGMTITGLLRGIKDEEADKPVQDAEPARDLVCARAAEPSGRAADTGSATAKRRVLARRILMAAAIVFVVMGIMNGGMRDVLAKAARICTECVGLG